MNQTFVAICYLCFTCIMAHGDGGFLGKIKKAADTAVKTVNNVEEVAPSADRTQQVGTKAFDKNAEGMKYRSEANAILNKIKAEQREANPSELYIIGRGFSYKPDGSPEVSYSDMNQSVIPRYYEKAARGGNTDALLYLLKFYGLGYDEYEGIGGSGAYADERRFREICELKVEMFSDYRIPAELSRLASLVDVTCNEIVNIKAQENAENEARRAAAEKQNEENKRRMSEELAQKKAEQEERRAEEQRQKEEQERRLAQEVAQRKAEQDMRLAEETKLKEAAKRQEEQLIAQRKAKEEILTDTKIKYPKADLFKSKITFYKNFEAGISYQWAVATLEKDGISFTIGKPSAFYGTSLRFKDGNNEVTLAFASETDGQENPEAILAMALIVLPISVPHESALKKYRDQYPDAKIKRDTEKKTVKNEPTLLNNGMILIPEYAWLITIDHIVSEHVKCDIISQTLVGKNYYANNIVSPKSLLFELLPDGSYKKGANLSHELEQAVPVSVAALKEITDQLGAVKIVLADLAIEKVFSDFKKNADTDARKNAEDEKRKKDAAALNF